MPVFLEEIKDLRFRAEHPVPVTQEFKMTLSDIRDHAGVGSGDLRQPVHFPEVADPHFQDRDLMLLCQVKDRQRQSELVVEIAFRFMHTVLLCQHGRDHFLGACLAHAAGHTDHGNPQIASVVFRDPFQRGQCRIDFDPAACRVRQLLFRDHAGSPL